MITTKGYIPTTGTPPYGIVVTFGMSMINMHGGEQQFTEFFEGTMKASDRQWIHKQRFAPKFDIAAVYCIVNGFVKYKLFYGGYSTKPIVINRANGQRGVYATWPHIILGGPLELAPHPIKFSGFKGFRYCTQLF